MNRVANVLFWSVISAAFIGPGTVTTAASAGALFGLELAWALVFSTLACIVLQEAVARLVIGSGEGLGVAIRAQAGGERTARLLAAFVGGSVVLGCAAYEAGNILGGVAGLELLLPSGTKAWTLLSGVLAAALLWSGTATVIARGLGFVVALMGAAFAITAIRLGPDPAAVLTGGFVPRLPEGSEVLVLGLVGTTVVPYNLFLGAGLARGQGLGLMRGGLIVAIALGGLISLAVMVVGTALDGPMRFDALAIMLRDRLGEGGAVLFGAGLFAAGFSSAVTAPLAAALTVGSLLPTPTDDLRSPVLRVVALGVLSFGVAIGLGGWRPVPVIVLAQAANGLVLPLVAVMVLLAVNDRRRLRDGTINGPVGNVLGVTCVAVTIVIGTSALARVAATVFGIEPVPPVTLLRVSAGIVAVVLVVAARRRRRRVDAG